MGHSSPVSAVTFIIGRVALDGSNGGSSLGQVKVLAFDIFGTVVDWRSGVAAHVNRIAKEHHVHLDGGAFADAWRSRYIPSMNLVRRGELPWMNLDALHRRSADELLVEFRVEDAFDNSAREELVHSWHRLPPWEDVHKGLSRLRKGYLLTALSNGGFALLTHLAKEAGIPLDCILSAELCEHYKPDREVYLMAARLLDVKPEEIMMVAAHKWDIEGAKAAGLRSAFVERPLEKGPNGKADRLSDVNADVGVHDFLELAKKLGCE
jgi:2-haloacid dehalogenase